MEKESPHKTAVVGELNFSPTDCKELKDDDTSCHSSDKDSGLPACRVCQCNEPDRRGNVALGFLGISPPNSELKSNPKVSSTNNNQQLNAQQRALKGSEFVEFISPSGEVFVCTADVELGLDSNSQDHLFELGCSCKNDLSLAHYACALKWFINHGSTVCEICGSVAKNVRSQDFKKILNSLKEYESLRERTVNGEPNPTTLQTDVGVDPDAIAAIRRQRLSEITSWFSPHNNSNSITVSQVVAEQPMSVSTGIEEAAPVENTTAKWAVECTGILVATGLLTVTLAWILAPHVGKRTAKNGLHILLGGVCALAVVVSFRFFVLTRIRYGPARYWAILFVFWFLVFFIWASRIHSSHSK